MADEIGPVDYMIVAFPGNQFKGEIAPALADLVDAGTIRIIDVAFVGKDENGDALAFELTELDPEVQKGLESLGIEVNGLFNEDDLMDAAEELEPNMSAALLVWENVWGSQDRPGHPRRRRRAGRLRAAAARRRAGRSRFRPRGRWKGELR